jgi:Flp pilus assembly protein TadG
MRDREAGISSVELALLLPVLLLLVFGALELARAVSLRVALGDGTWRAARYLGVYDPWDEAQASAIVQEALDHNALGSATARVTVSDGGGRSFGDVVTVRSEVEHALLIPFLSADPVLLTARHSQMVEVYP